MKLSREGLGLLSEGLSLSFRRSHPLLCWMLDLAVIAGQILLLGIPLVLALRWAGLI